MRNYDFATIFKMKANFPLSDIELNIEDDIIEKAEQIESGSSFKSINEVEKNLWVARMEENDEQIETEMQLSGSKVKSFTCECSIFKKDMICAHVAASLMVLRRRKIQDKERKEALKTPKREVLEAPTKLTIPHILKRIESNQLIEFIADYARNDKQFALALKTRFTGDLMEGNFVEHYKSLIDTTLKAAKNPKGKLTPKGWLQFFTLLDELKQKAEVYFKKGELNDSFELIKLSLPLIHRYLRSYDSPHTKLLRRQVLFFEILRLLTPTTRRGYSELLISPELSENIFNFMLAEYTTNVKFKFSDMLFEWLIQNVYTNVELEKVLQVIENQIVVQRGNFDIQDRLMTQKIQLLQKNGRVEDASKMILSVSTSPEILLFAIQTAIDNGDFVLAKSLCLNGLDIFKSSIIALEQIEELLLKIAQNTRDTEGVLKYAEKRYLKTLQWEYFLLLKEFGIDLAQIKMITQTIENLHYRVEKRDALAGIYFHEKQYDKLIELIKNLQSLELLKRFGLELWKIDNESGFELHKQIIYEYLFTHLGRPPAQRIRTILDSHIENKGWALADLIITALKNDFPERYSLKEEFDDMLLEYEKKQMLNKIGY
jgi:hypothetical protein